MDHLRRLVAGLMMAEKRSADQTTRIPGGETPGYPDWPSVPPPPGGSPSGDPGVGVPPERRAATSSSSVADSVECHGGTPRRRPTPRRWSASRTCPAARTRTGDSTSPRPARGHRMTVVLPPPRQHPTRRQLEVLRRLHRGRLDRGRGVWAGHHRPPRGGISASLGPVPADGLAEWGPGGVLAGSRPLDSRDVTSVPRPS